MDFLLGIYSEIGYFGIFTFIAACGFGFPIPEDITILITGYFVYTGNFHIVPSFIVSILGVLTSDTIVYSIGRRGRRFLLNHRILQKIFSERRIKKVERYFERFGRKTIFFVRFLPGIRLTTFFVAGIIKINYKKFILVDFCASLISVPLLLSLSYTFGKEIDRLVKYAKRTQSTIVLLFVLIILIYLLYRARRKRETIKIEPIK